MSNLLDETKKPVTEAEKLMDELWNDQPYSTNLCVIRDILFTLLRDKKEQDLIKQGKQQ